MTFRLAWMGAASESMFICSERSPEAFLCGGDSSDAADAPLVKVASGGAPVLVWFWSGGWGSR